MDSMKALNTSLPTAYSSRIAPPEQLLQAFRTAALSVTNLYKASVTEQNNSRQAGYQDALEDLLDFLDRENLGLQDGEGWRVRQWVTERYDGTANQQSINETEGDRMESEKASRGLSPSEEQNEEASSQPERHENCEMRTTEPKPVFEFTAGRSTQVNDTTSREDCVHMQPECSSSPASSSSTVRLEVLNRSTRIPQKQNNTRHNTRSGIKEVNFTSGTKRKLQLPDLFDISNVNTREGGGATKRGRSA